jgi:hypothetical protein
MKNVQIAQDADSDADPVLKANFDKLMEGMSVGRLREDMGHIGTSAIQSARKGSKGLRLETLEKFATYFNVQAYQLLLPDLGRTKEWPFALLTPEQLQELPQELLEYVEKVALDAWRTSKVPMPSTLVTSDTKGVHRKNGLTGTVPKPPDISKAGSAAQRSESEGQGRKAGDGRRG